MTVKITNINLVCLVWHMGWLPLLSGWRDWLCNLQVHVYLEVRACMCMAAAITSFSIKVRNSNVLPHP